MVHNLAFLLSSAALLAMGCGDGRDDMESAGTADLSETGAGDEDDGDIKLDVEDGETHGGDAGGDEGCEGIDFLFVIDKSSSMTSKQENLVDSFPGFVSAIEAKVEDIGANSFQILVTHTDTIGIVKVDPYCGYDCESDEGTCSIDGSACTFSKDASCVDTCRQDIDDSCDNGKACRDLLPECGACGCTLGAGRTDDKDGNSCGVEGGKAFLQSGQSDLEETFSCVGEVGIAGGNERQVDAILNAVSDEQNGTDGCNEGFVRDDSILVVTLITDEEDGEMEGPGVQPWDIGSSGTPDEWKEQLVSAKAGDEEAIVLLGLLGDLDLPQPLCTCDISDPSCLENGADDSPILREFVTSMPRHVVGSVCEPSYDAFFEQAVDLIKQTCDDFVPPG
jgi:hypothetical protein